MPDEDLSDIVSIPIEVEHFWSFLFGKQSTHGLAGHQHQSTWRKYLRKTTEHLERYVAANVCSDKQHRKSIEMALVDLREGVDGPAALREQAVFLSLTKLCLLLMGDLPNHWDRKVVNRPEHFLLNARRSVIYVQTPEQKARLVLSEIIIPRFSNGNRDEEAWDLCTKWNTYYNKPGRHAQFVALVEKKYPEEFRQVFS